MDGCPRQDPAYRLTTEEAPARGPLLFAGPMCGPPEDRRLADLRPAVLDADEAALAPARRAARRPRRRRAGRSRRAAGSRRAAPWSARRGPRRPGRPPGDSRKSTTTRSRLSSGERRRPSAAKLLDREPRAARRCRAPSSASRSAACCEPVLVVLEGEDAAGPAREPDGRAARRRAPAPTSRGGSGAPSQPTAAGTIQGRSGHAAQAGAQPGRRQPQPARERHRPAGGVRSADARALLGPSAHRRERRRARPARSGRLALELALEALLAAPRVLHHQREQPRREAGEGVEEADEGAAPARDREHRARASRAATPSSPATSSGVCIVPENEAAASGSSSLSSSIGLQIPLGADGGDVDALDPGAAQVGEGADREGDRGVLARRVGDLARAPRPARRARSR